MTDSWRMFIAVELPSQVVTFLGQTLDDLNKHTPPRTVRWVRPESIHLTLKFLGDVALDQREAIQQALENAVSDSSAFELATGQAGCFPNSRQPRVVWIGLERNLAALHTVRDAVERLIAPLGYPTEKRGFHPHLTLGRVQRDANRAKVQQLGKVIDDTTLTEQHLWTVDGITLFRSELTPSGAVYTPLFHAPFGMHT